MPQEAYIRLGTVSFNLNINPGVVNNDAPDFWEFKSLGYTGLQGANASRIEGGTNALWNWSVNNTAIPNLATGLAIQAVKEGIEFSESLYNKFRDESSSDPCVQLASLKNYVSGLKYNFSTVTDNSWAAKYGLYYSIPISIVVSGKAVTDDSKQEAWIRKETLTGVLDRPKATGSLYDYSSLGYDVPDKTIIWAGGVAYTDFPCT